MTEQTLVTPHVREVTATRFVLPLREGGSVPVSYTHLTLPTILLV